MQHVRKFKHQPLMKRTHVCSPCHALPPACPPARLSRLRARCPALRCPALPCRVYTVFRKTPVMSAYTLAWVVGKLEAVRGTCWIAAPGKAIPIAVWSTPDQLSSGLPLAPRVRRCCAPLLLSVTEGCTAPAG